MSIAFGIRRPVTNIDLKLLSVIRELHKTQSVSQAAHNLGLSQSAISMSLAKLRRHFNNPLFVRTSCGMEPTPLGVELVELLKRAEDLLETALECHVVFDPAVSSRTFHVHSSDIAQVTMLPKLMRHLREVAPGVSVDLQRISDDTPRVLESGSADVAIGFIHPMGAGFCQQRLFKERFVCVLRADHPRIGECISLKEFENEWHVAVTTTGTGHSVLERTLEANRITRHVALTVPGFLGVLSIILSTDYVIVLPEQFARHLAASAPLKVLPVPFHIPSYVIMQHWHERYSHDPANRWFRGVIADLLLVS